RCRQCRWSAGRCRTGLMIPRPAALRLRLSAARLLELVRHPRAPWCLRHMSLDVTATGVDLARLLQDPSLVARLSPEAARTLLAESATVVMQVAALQPVLLAQLAAAEARGGSTTEGLLDVKAAAARLRVSTNWLYRHARHLPFSRRIGRRAVRFDAAGLARWAAARRHGGSERG